MRRLFHSIWAKISTLDIFSAPGQPTQPLIQYPPSMGEALQQQQQSAAQMVSLPFPSKLQFQSIITDSCRASSYVRSNGDSQRSDPTASFDMHQPLQLCAHFFHTNSCTPLHGTASPLHSVPNSSRIPPQEIVKFISKFQPLLTTFSLAHEQVSCTQQFLISPEVMRQLQRYENCGELLFRGRRLLTWIPRIFGHFQTSNSIHQF